MSYHIYTTRGLVLSERPLREADRVYTVLTRDLGLVKATGLGVRKEASKLRGNLEPFSLSNISLVRGKEHWRAISAELIKVVDPTPQVARALSLLERLVQGESKHPELFEAVENLLLARTVLAEDEELEIKLVSQILYHLGYLKESDLNLPKKDLIKAINEGLQVSHL